MQFTPIRDFRAVVNGCTNHYRRGLSYTLREGNDILGDALRSWLERGYVRLGLPTPDDIQYLTDREEREAGKNPKSIMPPLIKSQGATASGAGKTKVKD